MKFDSKVELRRYQQLEAMQERGEIEDLKRQVRFPLFSGERYVDEDTPSVLVKVCDYVADHTYWQFDSWDGEGTFVVEDVKGGPVTAVFSLKAKLFRANYGYDIRVVRLASR